MITSTGPNLYIRFHSDASVNNRGFRAQWTVGELYDENNSTSYLVTLPLEINYLPQPPSQNTFLLWAYSV